MESSDQDERLPNKQILPLLIVLFSDSFAFTNIFSYITFMVQDFGVEVTRVGYLSGWLASAHYFSQFCTCFLWGKLSDRYGRKPFLLLGALGTFCSMLCLGLSTTFWQALLSRVVGGLFNSNLPIAKSYLADVCQPKNRASALSKTTLMFGLGQIAGPFYAGLVSQPALKYPGLFAGTFLAHYPYLIPCWTAALLSAAAWFFALVVMPESRAPSIIEHIDDEHAVNIGYAEVFPAWSMLKPELHGIGFTTSDIGLVWGLSGLTLVVFQSLFFARIANRFGCMRCCQFGLACWFLLWCYPLVQYANPLGRWAVWSCIVVLTVLRSVGIALVMPALNLGVNLASPPDQVGRVNGMNSTVAALSRGVFPFCITTLFAWSLHNGMSFPFDEFFVFIVCTLMAAATFALSFNVPNLGVLQH